MFSCVPLVSKPTGGVNLSAVNSIHTVTIIDNDILTLTFNVKQLELSWTQYPGAKNYKLWEIVKGVGSSEVDQTIPVKIVTNPDRSIILSKTFNVSVHDFDWLNTSYYVSSCDVDCINSNIVVTIDQSIKAIGYLKPKINATKGFFGFSMSMSDDGNTLAIGTIFENSSSSGINSTPVYDANFSGSGAVHVFTHSDIGTWSEQAYIKSSNSGMRDYFGWSMSLNSDGNLLVVGAISESSDSKVVSTNTTLSNELAVNSGAVYRYRRIAGVWTEINFIKAENAGVGDSFVSLYLLVPMGQLLLLAH